ncbi:hypothetical protein, partial [Dietzia sp. Cai40]|uniref:hypothetical protein n=1 Tax=Dietzia sp. Cai40 TaxID=1630635 RepID=UPI0019D5BF11
GCRGRSGCRSGSLSNRRLLHRVRRGLLNGIRRGLLHRHGLRRADLLRGSLRRRSDFDLGGRLSALVGLFFPLHLTGWLDRLGHAGLLDLGGTLLRGRPR